MLFDAAACRVIDEKIIIIWDENWEQNIPGVGSIWPVIRVLNSIPELKICHIARHIKLEHALYM